MYIVVKQTKQFIDSADIDSILANQDKTKFEHVTKLKAIMPLPEVWNPLKSDCTFITLNVSESKPSNTCSKQILYLLEDIIECYRRDLILRLIK